MKIPCPQCRQAIPVEEINIPTDMASCPKCEETFHASECCNGTAGNP